MPKNKKNKPKLNLTVREEQRNKLEQMAAIDRRSVSNLVEVMADERPTSVFFHHTGIRFAGQGRVPLNA